MLTVSVGNGVEHNLAGKPNGRLSIEWLALLQGDERSSLEAIREGGTASHPSLEPSTSHNSAEVTSPVSRGSALRNGNGSVFSDATDPGENQQVV
eukprot:scaffold1679_cov36-Prasinocladus_malaysianus.AAC.1